MSRGDPTIRRFFAYSIDSLGLWSKKYTSNTHHSRQTPTQGHECVLAGAGPEKNKIPTKPAEWVVWETWNSIHLKIHTKYTTHGTMNFGLPFMWIFGKAQNCPARGSRVRLDGCGLWFLVNAQRHTSHGRTHSYMCAHKIRNLQTMLLSMDLITKKVSFCELFRHCHFSAICSASRQRPMIGSPLMTCNPRTVIFRSLKCMCKTVTDRPHWQQVIFTISHTR